MIRDIMDFPCLIFLIEFTLCRWWNPHSRYVLTGLGDVVPVFSPALSHRTLPFLCCSSHSPFRFFLYSVPFLALWSLFIFGTIYLPLFFTHQSKSGLSKPFSLLLQHIAFLYIFISNPPILLECKFCEGK